MNKTVFNIITILCIGALLCLIGCGSKRTSPLAQQSPPPPLPELPDWIDSPPQDDDEFLYVVESGASRDMGRAQRKAVQNARASLALKIESAVTVLVKSFEEEVGGDAASAEANGLFAQISKTVADQELVGSSAAKVHRIQNADGLSNTVYVLMELPTSTLSASAVETISGDKAMYNRWRASEGFKELEHAVKEKRARDGEEQPPAQQETGATQ